MNANDEWVRLSEEDLDDLLVHLIGYRFGTDPQSRLDEIREERALYMRRFIRMARISPSDTVLELGSGCGFGTRTLACGAKRVLACDISPAYLSYAQRELADLKNIEFHLIESRNLSGIAASSVDNIVSTSVFIHLNLYDIYLYFLEFNRVLKPGGRVAIDFADMNRLAGGIRSASAIKEFVDLADHYRQHPESIAGLVQWNSSPGIRGAAKLAGFSRLYRLGNRLLFRKSRSPKV